MSEQPEEVQAEMAEPGPEEMAAIRQMLGAGQPRQEWVCVPCLNAHKLAIAALDEKLRSNGVVPGTPEYAQAMQMAASVGQVLAQNPGALQGLNGNRPDTIPPVRRADAMVNGTSCCMFCFVPQKQTSLLVAGGNSIPRSR